MPGTLITVLLAGVGIVLIVSAWEDKSIIQTLQDITSGKLSGASPTAAQQSATTYSYSPLSNGGANVSATGTGIVLQ